MVNKENIQKWVDALRSGEYKQGRGHLQKGDKYCCLGVACKISDKLYNPSSINLTEATRLWLGLEVCSPTVKFYNDAGYEYLTNLNDSHRLNFNQIADLIEQEYLLDTKE